MRCNAVQAIEGRAFLGFTAKDADVNPRVAKIGTDFRSSNGHESDYARVLGRFREECRYLDADRFGDAVRSAGITQRRPPLKSTCAPPAPSGSTRARRRP